jgi:hypothetical protein
MSKIKINYQDVETNALNNLDYAISYLDTSYTKLKNISIPSDYSYRGDLINVLNDIYLIKDDISKIRKFIVDSNKKVDVLEDNHFSNISNIENIVLKERIKLVRNS